MSFTLYRAYDEAGQLLYIGVSQGMKARLKRHKSKSAWFADCRKITEQIFPDRALAEDAEWRDLMNEDPDNQPN